MNMKILPDKIDQTQVNLLSPSKLLSTCTPIESSPCPLIQSVENQMDKSVNSVSDSNEHIYAMPILNKKTSLIMRKAKKRLRGLLTFINISKEITAFGTNSTLMRAFIYRVRLERQMQLSTSSHSPIKKRDSNTYMFHPHSKFIQIWNLFMLLMLFYVFFITPWVIAFEEVTIGSRWFYVDFSADFFFLCDILITLNSAYYNKDTLIMSRKEIFLKYLRGLLLIDLMSIFPFYIYEGNKSNSLMRIVRITKVSKVLRASKLFTIITQITHSEWVEDIMKRITSTEGLARLIISMFFMVTMAHITACIWFFTSRLDDFAPDTWVVRNDLLDSGTFHQYLASLYWAFTILTTVGFGDIHAKTQLEMGVCIIWLIFGIGFYAFLVGTLTSVLSKLDTKNAILQENLRNIERLAQNYELPKILSKKMKKEVTYFSDKTSMLEEQRLAMFNMLSKELKLEVCLTMHGRAAEKVSFIKKQDCVFITNVVPQLQYEHIGAAKNVYIKGEHPDAVYFVVTGRVDYIIEEKDLAFKSIVIGGYFGEIELIFNVLREFTVRTQVDSSFLVMRKKLFKEVMSQYSVIANEIRETAMNKRVKDQQAFSEITQIAKEVRRNSSKVEKHRTKVRGMSMDSACFSIPNMNRSRTTVSLSIEHIHEHLKDLIRMTEGLLASKHMKIN